MKEHYATSMVAHMMGDIVIACRCGELFLGFKEWNAHVSAR